MLGRDVYGAVEPRDRPAVEGEVGENVLVAQRGKELVLLDKRQAVEYDTAAVVKVQFQQIVAYDAGGCDPFRHPRSRFPLFVSPHYYILEAVPLWRSFSCDIPSKLKGA